jgi:DNA-directed RNA polymerase subunit K/omega
VLVAGGSAREAGRALVGEGRRGFVEGFVAGAGGGAARVLGPALGVGGQVSGQILRRVAAEAIVNGTTTMVDALVHGASVEQAVTAGLRAAALSAPGAVIGSSGNRLVRELGGPLAAGGTAYVGALAAGQSREEALRAATIAVTTTIVTSRAQHGAEADARLEARGRAIGEQLQAPPSRAPAASIAGAIDVGAPTAPSAARGPVVPPREEAAVVGATGDHQTPPRASADNPPAAASQETAAAATSPAHETAVAPQHAETGTHPEGTPAGASGQTTAARPGGRRPGPFPDEVVDEFLNRLDEPGNPFALDISARRARQLATGERNFALDQPVAFDIDEPHAVGATGVSRARAHGRATDPHNRQLLDPATNRYSKHVAAGDVARGRQRLAPVSVADDPGAIFTRRFDEVTELRQVFDDAAARVAPRRDLGPTAVKAAINENIRDIIRNGRTPAGVAVRDALRSQGFELVPGRGIVAVRPGP